MSKEEQAKQYVIYALLYDDEYGYGSKTNTLKRARLRLMMQTNL